jgi:hypothetical protein
MKMAHTLGDGEVMKWCFLCSLILAAAASAADSAKDPFINATISAADIKAMQRHADPAIHKAVVEALKTEVPPVSYHQSAPAYGALSSDIMTAAFIDAKVPDCLHSEGLKRQPTFLLTGYLALPFSALAKLRGKCI